MSPAIETLNEEAWGHTWCQGSIRVKVYAGRDPVTGRKLHRTETIPVGPRQQRLVEQAQTRFLNEVDEKRNPKTRATVDQLMEKYLAVLDVDATTKRGYRSKYNIHIKPLLGTTKLTKLASGAGFTRPVGTGYWISAPPVATPRIRTASRVRSTRP